MAFDMNSYQTEYKRQNYEKIEVLLPKGRRQVVKDFAKSRGMSTSQIVVEALETTYRLDLSKKNGL